MIRFISYLTLLFFLFSCKGKENKPSLEKELQEGFQMSFQKIGIKVKDSLYIKNKTLYMHTVQDSGYYVDEMTNKLLSAYILFNHYQETKELDSINIFFEYKGLADKEEFHYSRMGINKIHDKFLENPLFVKLLPYIIKSTNANDIIYIDNTISEISNYIPSDKFTFKGDGFWDFIYDYALNCCNPNSDVHMNMDKILYASKFPEFQTRPDIFEYVIETSKHYCKKISTSD